MDHQIWTIVENWYSSATIAIERVQVQKLEKNLGQKRNEKSLINAKALNAWFALLVLMI